MWAVAQVPSQCMDGSPTHRLAAWYRGLNPDLVDGVIAAVLVVAGFLSTSGRGPVQAAVYEPRGLGGTVLILLATVPFAVRRRAPLLVLLTSTTAIALYSGLGHNEGLLPLFIVIAAATVGYMCDLRTTLFGAAVVFAELLALHYLSRQNFALGSVAFNVALFTTAFMFGGLLRSRRERIDALEDRAGALQREHEEEARRAVADERLRIARELHDVVAHSMGVIAVQAGVGEHVIDSSPAEAKRALQAISEVSRSTLAEIRYMLGALRDDEVVDYTPAPGLSDLDRLARELDGAGVPVRVSIEGERRELPRGVDVAAYRIVQEALTNVLKHAGNARASVVVRYQPGALALEIVDDGRGVNGTASSGGHGLIGMRERVSIYGGTLSTGPRAGGGYAVAAVLPYEDVS